MTVKVAIVDSGINAAHPHVRGVAGGLAFQQSSDGRIVREQDFTDRIGHGTAIAGVVRHKAPQAGIYAVKIFDRILEASTQLLLAGLEWAVEQRLKIIHLSLGLEKQEAKEGLDRLCRQASDLGLVVVASARSPEDGILPAALETVIGVYWDRDCQAGDLVYHPDCPVEFGAYGYPRPLPGLPLDKNFRGHSFAAARVTARAAFLLEQQPGLDATGVKKILGQAAVVSDFFITDPGCLFF